MVATLAELARTPEPINCTLHASVKLSLTYVTVEYLLTDSVHHCLAKWGWKTKEFKLECGVEYNFGGRVIVSQYLSFEVAKRFRSDLNMWVVYCEQRNYIVTYVNFTHNFIHLVKMLHPVYDGTPYCDLFMLRPVEWT